MQWRLLSGAEGERKFLLVYEVGDDVGETLLQFAKAQHVKTAWLSGIGGLQKATVGFFNLQAKRYEPIEVAEQVELLSIVGNIALYEGEPKLHLHAVLGKRDGAAVGGHFLSGTVRPTLELAVEELGEAVTRIDKPDIGLPLIEFG